MLKKLSESEINNLKSLSKTIRELIITTITKVQSGHPGGSLSVTDILTTLYAKCLNHYNDWDKNPDWANRDRVVLSKGHASATLYSILAHFGYFDKEELSTFRQVGSRLQGHPSYGTLPGIEVSTGSLGQGLSLSVGMALGLRLDKRPSKVYTIMGDGELQEGQVWEAAMSASHNKLGNLIAFIDKNKLQIDGPTEDIKSLEPLADKWKAFGWHVIEIDGHDHAQIYNAIQEAKQIGDSQSVPVMIIADTIKGKGVSFMENNAGWHGTPPSQEQCEIALKEIRGV